jgi:glycolate oxidase FAD binding subunit
MKLERPETEAELAAAVRATDTPLRIQGGGTRPIGVPVNAVPLSTAGLSGIELYEPGALTMVARAGTPLREIEAALAAEGQRLAFEPMDHRGVLDTNGAPTIGGVFAANVSGPRRIQCGAARDFLLGVRFVDGRGEVVRNGGRVMKNVTGYDLVKLMAGSHGTLGILTEVAFKVLPASATTTTLRCEGLGDRAAIAALCRALGTPFEVTGAAHLQRGEGGTPQTLLRLEGAAASVAYRAEALAGRLAEFGAFRPDDSATPDPWPGIRDAAAFAGRKGDVWRLSVRPTDAPGIVARLDGAEAVYDWGGGLVWLLVTEDTGAERIRQAVAESGGHATLMRGNRAGGAFQPLPPAVAALQAGLRRRFDPRGILNPGLMGQAAMAEGDA